MLNIGEKIKNVFDKSGLAVTEFAKRINTSRENVYGIFSRKSIDTELLMKISQVLNHDFFLYYVHSNEILELRNQVDTYKQEIAYLKKINSFLEKENKSLKKKP